MLHPPTAPPSRGARAPRRPGAVALLVAALAAVLLLSVAVTARGGTDTPAPRAATPVPTRSDTTAPPDAGPAGGRADTPYETPGQDPSGPGESSSPRPSRTAAGRDRTAQPRTAHRTGAVTAPTGSASAPATGGVSPRPSASRTAGPARTPYDVLRAGACFDMNRDAPGTVVPRPCDTPHDAELVVRLRLTGSYADDGAVRDAAAALCRAPLRSKAAEQPLGTRWTTFVHYPYRTSYLLGDDAVACSLAAPSDTAGKLTAPLQ
ncbi:hypothetical protein ACFU3J_22850 [Streptomyces sp. NPDC057411]|uniref:hypothetical protein n=1 Tax=unclassified Streptomyces TaxID=2593676 RepID=UPI00362511DC